LAFRPVGYNNDSSGQRRRASLPDWSAIRWIATVTIAVFVLQAMLANTLGGDPLGRLLGLRAWWLDDVDLNGADPSLSLSFNLLFPLQLFTYMLVHQLGSLGHILGNLLLLWVLGRDLEPSLGRAGFLRLYVTAGVVGGLAQWATYLFGGTVGSVIGASGAVYGVMILAVLRNPQRTILLLPIPIPIPVWLLAGFYVFGDLQGLLFGGGPTAYLVHIAGAAVGWLWFKRGDVVGKVHGQYKRAKTVQKQEATAGGRREMDRILRKIQAEGLSSLSKSERSFLNERSRELREERS
jgi:membrane associated rhomboid family serine protease